jgi:hypothetical protein
MTIEREYVVPKLVTDLQGMVPREVAIESTWDYKIDITSRIFP